ncbi:hypothetical protein PA598K_01487 [Paenibacillus sp. 598K]|uniref:hypothetical protein n=1 Tax=Paenibacillus sp. 598K TaxID=1117987 RepID=UPI000FFA7CB5|nr:hypothetical protein [Paenibacillus sp. 598K]GBF73202.1 hypothetical protein PA598K_01487 [Paenibacillus sp. 598K]
MPRIEAVIRAEIDPTKPVQEVCGVIQAMTPYHPGEEVKILEGIKEAIEKRLEQLKGGKPDGKSVHESGRK